MSPSKKKVKRVVKKKVRSKKADPVSAYRKFVADDNPDALFLDPASTYDWAIIGKTHGSNAVAVYDYQLIVYQLCSQEKLSEEEAIDHIEYNILGSIGSENYPIVTSHDYVQ